jgi:hypothetical protein
MYRVYTLPQQVNDGTSNLVTVYSYMCCQTIQEAQTLLNSFNVRLCTETELNSDVSVNGKTMKVKDFLNGLN